MNQNQCSSNLHWSLIVFYGTVFFLHLEAFNLRIEKKYYILNIYYNIYIIKAKNIVD